MLTRLTTILVACFFVTSLALAWLAKQDSSSSSVLDGPAPAAIEQTVPDTATDPAPITDEVPQIPDSN